MRHASVACGQLLISVQECNSCAGQMRMIIQRHGKTSQASFVYKQDAAVKLRSREYFAESILASPEPAFEGRSQTFRELQKLLVMQRLEAQASLRPVPGSCVAQAQELSGMTVVAWASRMEIQSDLDCGNCQLASKLQSCCLFKSTCLISSSCPQVAQLAALDMCAFAL